MAGPSDPRGWLEQLFGLALLLLVGAIILRSAIAILESIWVPLMCLAAAGLAVRMLIAWRSRW